jgi:hypothetical protein
MVSWSLRVNVSLVCFVLMAQVLGSPCTAQESRVGAQTRSSEKAAPAPVGINGRDLSGGTWAWRWVMHLDGTQAYEWARGPGPSSIGLYVRVWGKVTQIDPGGTYFYIDDGSGLWDWTMTPSLSGALNKNVGVRISCSGVGLREGDYVVLDGISGWFDTGDGYPRNQILYVQSSSIRILNRPSP